MKLKRMTALLCILILVLSVIGCRKKKEAKENEVPEVTQGVSEVTKEPEEKQPTSEPTDDNNEQQTPEEIGCYIETPIELDGITSSESVRALGMNADGNLEVYTCIDKEANTSEMYCYTIKDGTTERKPLEWANKAVHDDGGFILYFEMGQDGKYFMMLQSYLTIQDKDGEDASYVTSRIYQDAGNGTDYVEITPKDWNPKDTAYDSLYGTYATTIHISKDEIVTNCLGMDSVVYAYSLKDQKKLDIGYIETQGLMNTSEGHIVKDNCIYYVPTNETNIHVYDLITKEEKVIECNIPINNARIRVSDDGDVYVINKQGVHCCHEDGTMWETVIDNNSLFGSPNYNLADLLILDGIHKEFYACFTAGKGKVKLAGYRFSTDPLPEVTDELNIYSLRNNKTLHDAILNYQTTHPEVKINYNVAMTEDGLLNISDEIRTINTELLAGKGADIYLLEGLPVNSYIEKGALLDLSDILSPMIQDGTLLSNIAKNYVKDGKIYSMPIRYFIPLYMTNYDVESKLGTVKDIAELNKTINKKFIPSLRYEELLRFYLYSYYDDFMIDDKAIDETKLRAFLEDLKAISDNVDMWDRELSYGEDVGFNSNICQVRDIFKMQYMIQSSVDSYAATGYFGDIEDFNYYIASVNYQKGHMSTVNDVFMPSGVVGINVNTQAESLAKDFVTYLFSEEIQSTRNHDGFPVNANSLEEWCNIEPTEDEHMIFSSSNKEGMYVEMEVKGTTVEEKHEIKKDFMQKVSMPIFDNETVLNMILEESVGYFNGEKTLDQAISDTTSKINLYLSE